MPVMVLSISCILFYIILMATACSNINTSFKRLSDSSAVIWVGNGNALEQCYGVMCHSCQILGQFSEINFIHRTGHIHI